MELRARGGGLHPPRLSPMGSHRMETHRMETHRMETHRMETHRMEQAPSSIWRGQAPALQGRRATYPQ